MTANNVNFNYLEELSGGNREFEAEILGIYASEVNSDLSAIANAISGNDLTSAAAVFHKLKSSIAIVGLDFLREPLTEIELGLNNGNSVEQHQNAINLVVQELERSILAVQERLSN